MMFKKPLKLTAYTWESDIFTNDKPTFNKTDQTDWMRLLPPSYDTFDQPSNSYFEMATAKNCPGIKNFIGGGIKFRMWAHLHARVHPNGYVEELPGSFKGNNPAPLFAQHPKAQYEHIYQRNKTSFKLNNPWIMQCNKPTKFVFVESHYSTNHLRENNVSIAPGIIDFKYQKATNIHLIVDVKEEPYELIIPYGTPLMTLFPMTEEKINFDCELVSKDEYERINITFPRCPMRKYYQLIKNLS